jgi:hypothetical protein
VRPVCSLEVPQLVSLDANRRLVQKIEAAIGAAYAGIANVDEVLVLINHYPLRNVGWRRILVWCTAKDSRPPRRSLLG